MKKLPMAFCVIMMALLGLMPLSYGADESERASDQEIKQETRDLIEALKGYGADQRDRAIQQAEEAVNKLDSRIDAFQARIDRHWSDMSDDARKQARANLHDLQKQRVELAERYGSWKNSSTQAWEHMKQGFSNAYQSMHDAWEKAEREYERGNE